MRRMVKHMVRYDISVEPEDSARTHTLLIESDWGYSTYGGNNFVIGKKQLKLLDEAGIKYNIDAEKR